MFPRSILLPRLLLESVSCSARAMLPMRREDGGFDSQLQAPHLLPASRVKENLKEGTGFFPTMLPRSLPLCCRSVRFRCDGTFRMLSSYGTSSTDVLSLSRPFEQLIYWFDIAMLSSVFFETMRLFFPG